MRASAIEFLDAAGVEYTVKPHNRDVYTCEDAARERGVRLSQIVKCMVGRDPTGGLHVMLLPGDKTLKLRKARQAAGGRRIELVPREGLEVQFGATVGAISPVQYVGRAAIYMDTTVLREEFVDISSGEPDAGVELRARDLLRVLGATECDIVSDKERRQGATSS